VPIVGLLAEVLAADNTAADDASTTTTVPVVAPQQQRLGVFPPDDPACR